MKSAKSATTGGMTIHHAVSALTKAFGKRGENVRELTSIEIEKLASRKGVKRIAVENFLGTNTSNPDAFAARSNLYMDAGLYKWNSATVNAILKGIDLACL